MVQLGHALFFELRMPSTFECIYETALKSYGSFCTKLRREVIFEEHGLLTRRSRDVGDQFGGITV